VPRRILILAAICAISAAALWVLRSVPSARTERAASPQNDADQGQPPFEPAPAAASSDAKDALRAEFFTALARLRSEADPVHAAAILSTLAAKLRTLAPVAAAALIEELLTSGADVDLPLGFAIAADGTLEGAPSFRVWLLDQLGQIHPEAAALYASRVLAAPRDADEWAIALRNFLRARQAPGGHAYASGKLRELLANPRWREEQSAGWLEAFDAAVHLRAVDLAPDLASLLTRTDPKDKAAAHAAYLALDRLVQAEPENMLAILIAAPEMMTGRELTRASYFARADVRDPAQRTLVERYLLDPSRSPEELAKFAGLYPNANLMLSNNLLTRVAPPPREEIAARDRAALLAAQEWLADPRFAPLREHLATIQRRLGPPAER
jgi:hypothetical protein